MSTTPSIPSSPVSFPVPQHSALVVQSATPNGPAVAHSLAPPPQHHTTTSIGSTLHPTSSLLSASSGHSGPTPSQLSLHNPATASVSSVGNYTVQRDEVRKAWVDVEGEVTFLKKDSDSWIPIHIGTLATKDSGGKSSWRDGSGILLDTHLLWFEKKETTPSKKTKPSHVIRPIPLEYLQLASFTDEPEVRKEHLSLFKRVGSGFRASPTKKNWYPFTVYHVAAKITRRYTLFTESGTDRNKWKAALQSAIEARKSQQDPKMLYEPRVIDDGFFKKAPRIQFNREMQYTGRVVCSTSFCTDQGEDYIAIGCTTGVYISKNGVNHSFQKVLEFNEPTSIVAIPKHNKFLVHCELKLSSYPLDKVIRAPQGNAEYKDLGDSEETPGLVDGDGEVLFFKAGRVADRTLIVYASKISKQFTSRVFELTDSNSYQPLGSVLIPEAPHGATFILDKVAVYTSKAIYMVEPTSQSVPNPTVATNPAVATNSATATNPAATTSPAATTNPCYKVVPKLSNSEHDPNAFQRLLTRTKVLLRIGKSDTPKILELVGKASILGAVTRQNDILVIYDDLGCFVNEAGKPTDDSSYYIEWERKATSFARSGSHLILFSSGYIEVRDIDTGKLVWLKELHEIQPLRSGWTESPSERPRLVASITSKENDGSHSQRLVELVPSDD